MKPTSHPEQKKSMASKNSHTQLIQLKAVDCPEGTVPILRTRQMVILWTLDQAEVPPMDLALTALNMRLNIACNNE